MKVTLVQQPLAEKLSPGPLVPPDLQSKAPWTLAAIVQQSNGAELQRPQCLPSVAMVGGTRHPQPQMGQHSGHVQPLATIAHRQVVHRVECALQLRELYGLSSYERSWCPLCVPTVGNSLWRQLEGRRC